METSLKVANFMESPHGRLRSGCSLPPIASCFPQTRGRWLQNKKQMKALSQEESSMSVYLSEVIPGEQQAEVLANHS